jgi:soluble lytic murein transglycosylase-like protein
MRTLPLFAVAILALGFAPSAGADLWGYVDERGVAHFAPEQRDARYRLFFKGRSSLDPAPLEAVSPTPAAMLRDHPLFKRVTEHPNVARFAPLIEQYAKTHGLDAALVKAMIAVESAFDPAAVSPKGAVGLMQVMPATGERYGVAGDRRRSVTQKLADPALNVRIGTRFLRDLLQRFDQDTVLALAAYNAGEGAVEQYDNQVPPYPETRAYVQLVQRFRDLYEPPPPARVPASPPARVTIPSSKAPPAGLPAS